MTNRIYRLNSSSGFGQRGHKAKVYVRSSNRQKPAAAKGKSVF